MYVRAPCQRAITAIRLRLYNAYFGVKRCRHSCRFHSKLLRGRVYQHPNEHLTMQIAQQVFGIETAESALVFFVDGTPAYDLLNTALHIEAPPFALKDGLYPAAQGKLIQQFYQLGEKVGLAATTVSALISKLTSQSEQVLSLVTRSFLSERLKRSYIQYYQRRVKKLAN